MSATRKTIANERTQLIDHHSPASEAVPTQASGLDPMNLTKANRTGILLGIWLATFLASVNSTLVATLVTKISSEFDSANQGAWLGTSFLLAGSTFTPLYGRLSNVLGRRGANQVALILLSVGTLFCAGARNINELILARFIQGCGGGGLFTTANIITSDMYSLRDRSMAQGIANIFSGAGQGVGGPIGGYVADRLGWRAAFLLELPVAIVAYVLVTYNLRYEIPGKKRTPLEILGRIDYLGSLFLFITVGSSLFALSFKYNQDLPWSDFKVISCCVGVVLGTIFFLISEIYIAVEPVLAPQFLKMKIPTLVGINNFLVPMCNFSIIYYFPLYFEVVENTTSSVAGLHLLPNAVSLSFGSLFAGYVMHRTGRYKTLNLVFGILPFIATLLLIRLNPKSGTFTKWISNAPLGFGNAVVLQTTYIAMLVSIKHSAMAVGTGYVQLFRGIGQVGGVAISSAIFQSYLQYKLQDVFTGEGAQEQIRRVRHDMKAIGDLPPDVEAAVREVAGGGLRRIFIFAACCTAGAFLIRLPIPEQSLDADRSDKKAKRRRSHSSFETTSSEESYGDEESTIQILSSAESVTGSDDDESDDEPTHDVAHEPAPDLDPPQDGETLPLLSTSLSSVVSWMRPGNDSAPTKLSRRASRLSMFEPDAGVDPEPVSRSLASYRSRESTRISQRPAVSRSNSASLSVSPHDRILSVSSNASGFAQRYANRHDPIQEHEDEE